MAKIKSSPFSLSIDGSNDQSLEKINLLTATLCDEDKNKFLTHFLRMCLSKSNTTESIFQSVNGALEKHRIPWKNCIALDVDITSANVGKHKPLIADV